MNCDLKYFEGMCVKKTSRACMKVDKCCCIENQSYLSEIIVVSFHFYSNEDSSGHSLLESYEILDTNQ